jgi:hypothetical protein
MQGSSRDLESKPADIFLTNGKSRPAPLLLAPISPDKLISPSFGTSQYHQDVVLSPSHPFSARLPPELRAEEVIVSSGKGKGRVLPGDGSEAMDVDGPASPRTVLLNAVANVPLADAEPDTPLLPLVRPGRDLIVDPRPDDAPNEDPPDLPPIPTVGSHWASREAFKEACQAHANAKVPPFGFTTPTSSTSGPVRFIIYACRHNRKGGGGCPYLLRCQAMDASEPNAEWCAPFAAYCGLC